MWVGLIFTHDGLGWKNLLSDPCTPLSISWDQPLIIHGIDTYSHRKVSRDHLIRLFSTFKSTTCCSDSFPLITSFRDLNLEECSLLKWRRKRKEKKKPLNGWAKQKHETIHLIKKKKRAYS